MKLTVLSLSLLALSACSAEEADQELTPGNDLSKRAYVISELSDELYVIDTETMSHVGTVSTSLEAGELNANHMSVVSPDGSKIFITATDLGRVAVVDAESLELTGSIAVGAHDTHANARTAANELWVVNEDDNTVSVIDMDTEEVTHTIAHESIFVPHMVRFDQRDELAYIANIAGNQISVVDLETYEVVDTLLAPGVSEVGPCDADPCGFSDTQIDPDGLMFASYISSGTVLVYDTVSRERVAEIPVGPKPWSAFVDVVGGSRATYLVPNFGDSTVSVLDRSTLSQVAVSSEGDSESYGINYSPLAPDLAFVLNRNKNRIAVVNAVTGELVSAIDMGGTTETAATTADGRYLLAPVSSAGALSVLDVTTLEEVARFEGVGTNPWSVTTLSGQNYCH